MPIDIRVPSPGESITEVEIASWLVSDGDYVEKDQELAEIESDKATLPLIAQDSGKIKILAETGKAIKVGTVACTIDTAAKAPAAKSVPDRKMESKPEKEPAEYSSNELPVQNKKNPHTSEKIEDIRVTPVAARMMKENGITSEDIIQGLKRIGKNDVEAFLQMRTGKNNSREIRETRMSSLRRKLSERLVRVKNETAMLTTFNEVDMQEIMRLRKTHQNAFIERHGIKLGYMSFFTKAVTLALQIFPEANSRIEGENMITPEYCDIGIAVQTDKGLMVPVLKNAENMSLAEIEKQILRLAEKARATRLTIEEMTGGTFSITNGGVFGSLLSTPILNPPQSAILGMHNIVERPVAIKGKIEIRPMMYIALSYDHRLIDGRTSVSFLVKIKELLEDPRKMIHGSYDPEKVLLEL